MEFTKSYKGFTKGFQLDRKLFVHKFCFEGLRGQNPMFFYDSTWVRFLTQIILISKEKLIIFDLFRPSYGCPKSYQKSDTNLKV